MSPVHTARGVVSVSTSFRRSTMMILAASFLFVILPATAWAQVTYETSPYWESGDTEVSTGAALADIDQDGLPDLVVSNGNDIYRERVAVYYNQGSGVFPSYPDWESSDIDYHGHLDVGDVNGDGWPDVAVSVYLGAGGFNDPGEVKLYLNDGAGTLSSTPSWTCADPVYTFRCAFGDVDLDGDLDLAVACGESYNNRPRANRIYRNTGGMLETTPFWTSTEVDSSYDVAFADADGDGDLDLAFCNSGDPNRIHYNNGGTLSTSAGWSSLDPSSDANTLAWGDVNGDGDPDLAVADNNQLGGTGRFKVYMSNGSGGVGLAPAWSSTESGYGSSVVFSDVDDDGDLDLATGQWWGPVRIYLNSGGTLASSASWTSSTGSVIERICFADVDLDDTQVFSETFDGSGGTLFTLSRQPVESLVSIEVDGVPLGAGGYCCDLENAWISLAADPGNVDVAISYVYSYDQDMGVSNWDSSVGNYLFRNTGSPVAKTLSTALSCSPDSGTVPFSTVMSVSLGNTYLGLTRRIAGRLDVDLAGGQHFSNWRSGWSNIDAGGSYDTSWNQNLPALGNLIGANVFTLEAEDVTPSPYNQPPHPPSGDTDTSVCTVVGNAP